MAVIAARLDAHGDWAGIGVFAVTFAAVWSTWTSFVVYADLAEETTRIAVMMTAAALVGVMAAALGDLDERANAFALAVVVCRIVAARAALRTGRLLASWPGVQLGGITVPWIVSLWVAPPAKYWLWAAALALELLIAVRRASDDQEEGRALAERLTARRRRRTRSDAAAPLVVVRARAGHLGERLGTFMIIVLGEAVAQLVRGASAAEWERGLAVTSLAAFALVAALWWLTFRQRSREAQRRPYGLRVLLPAHLVMTGAVVAFAAALGELLQHPHAHPEEFWRWTAGGGLAVWFALTAALAAGFGPGSRWVARRALVTAAAVLAAAAVAAGIDTIWFMLMLLAAVAWTALPMRAPRAPRPAATA
jgi:low temperature requirement protein LtrA